ncbi:hypothetical protein [Pseudomonas sp. SLFW]|uniref:hypothetical protein n=1 Tax=Pseudomonas sp. SLFW TaxID=2683259 RepID=UPI0014136BD2|nr:hypothetical protein [Pseudomonas sp. SLFW]NBB11798.1 hypothetical protein [Pseudomonas sp. SLFW]
MIVTKHKHLLKAQADFGHLVAKCGKTVSSRAIAGEGQATCSICLLQANRSESKIRVIRGCV